MWLPDHVKVLMRFVCVACVNSPPDGSAAETGKCWLGAISGLFFCDQWAKNVFYIFKGLLEKHVYAMETVCDMQSL